MINKYAQFIKDLRTERGFSQSFVADKLNLSRPSYTSIENGNRGLTLEEAQKLKDLFGISIEEFAKATLPKYKKYKQMIIAFLKSSISTDGKVPKTKLAKLLYLADFAWYYANLESMSGMQYLRRTYGPVPDPYFRALAELEEEGKITVDYKSDAILIGAGAQHQKLDLLKTEEVDLMKKISTKWKNKRTQEIIDFTHEQLPYKLCAPDEMIPYELIIQQDPDYVY
ncbi:MAG: helix-turn-helix domain-containing protein [bacterium]|nr:helix-turn-helix domain-containing protein [bacterium]